MKKENGMSHITLIFWIAIILVVCVMGTKILLKETENRQVENLTTDMLLLQGKIKVIAQANEMNKEEHPLIGRKLTENLEDEKVKYLIDNKVITEEGEALENYYIIDSENLKSLNLEDNLNGEYYIVNYKTYEIIHSTGVELHDQMHYTLTELIEHRDMIEKSKEQMGTDNINQEVINEEIINAEQN